MSQRAQAKPTAAVRYRAAGWTVAAIVLIGFNLRPAVSGLGPILGEIDRALGFSNVVAGILTTLPVVCFGLVSPIAPGLAHRIGTERTILLCLALLTIGTAMRGLGGTELLFLGMIAIGFGIGVVNVLLPSVIKQDFPHRIGALTGLYTSALCAGAAASVLLTSPFERAIAGTWRWGLGIWAVPAALAFVLWLPQLVRRRATSRRHSGLRHDLWRNALAWQVTAYITALTALAYTVFAWGPTLLQDRGMSVDASSRQMALSFVVQAISGFVLPLWAARRRNQRFYAVFGAAIALVGLLGWVFAPIATVWLWTICAGIGQGGAFGLALALIGLRASNAETAAQLSGMAQTVCYVCGGLFGPFAVGLVHQWSGGWNAVGILFAAVGAIAIAAAWGAGRAGTTDNKGTKKELISLTEQRK
jgi:CP family cyanate transporter-like MFS transporter